MEDRTVSISTLVLVCLLVNIPKSGGTGFYADNGLQQTVILERLPGRERKEMQQEILTLLGLHHRPKPKSHGADYSAPMFMLDLYKTLQNEDGEINDNEFHHKGNVTIGNTVETIDGSDVIISFANHARKINHLRREKDRTFYFDFSELSTGEIVSGAELRLYKEPFRKKVLPYVIEIFMIKQGKDPEDKTLDLESNFTVKGDYEGWITLNVTRAADMWTSFPDTNMGLYMRITDPRKDREIDPEKFGIIGHKGPEDKQSFMVGFFKMSVELNIRRKRSASRRPSVEEEEVMYGDDPYVEHWGGYSTVERLRRKHCQKRALYVSFKDLGWQDWIIAPDGYTAYYCFGECSFPLGSHMNATNHAIVQTLVHLMAPQKVPKPCCAPTKLSAISVLYFDKNSNVVLKKYKNMVVKACGCH